jgi:1-acyl-sn-glycerol-3-phosphate acyltransferase
MPDERVLAEVPAQPHDETPRHDGPPVLDGRALIHAITRFLANQDEPTLERIRLGLQREFDATSPEAVLALNERLARAGSGWEYYPRDPVARRIHQVLADMILEDSVLHGSEHTLAIEGTPVVIFANHLSYSDANLLDVLLTRCGAGALADRMTVIAGPKVYSSLKRRFSSLCFGTIKTPQSTSLSSEDAVMNPREVARAARRCIEIAHDRLRAGDALLVFAEGTRSRTGEMQQTLSAASRYLDGPESWILPVGIVGSEAMFPIGEDALYAVTVVIRAGRPFHASALRELAHEDRRLMMDAVGVAIAELLPQAYRGAYADADPALEEARAIFSLL